MMVERVARALEERMKQHSLDRDAVDFDVLARDAISAMREPTEAMKTCSEEVHWDYSCAVCGGLTEGWYAMIDAALKP